MYYIVSIDLNVCHGQPASREPEFPAITRENILACESIPSEVEIDSAK